MCSRSTSRCSPACKDEMGRVKLSKMFFIHIPCSQCEVMTRQRSLFYLLRIEVLHIKHSSRVQTLGGRRERERWVG